MSEYILELKDIVKKFPGVIALNHVQFQLKKGEIHALMGENGAGKSTFIKVITGVYEPDSGKIFLKGKEVTFRSPLESAAASIVAIYQHSTAYPYLTVAENIFIGHYKTKRRRLDWNAMYSEAKELLESLGSTIDPKDEMGSLTVAEQQIVEIAKAISTHAEILIMDEPTAALSERECGQLYKIAEKLRDNGTSIIFISHRIKDMYCLASRVTVFRDSEYIGTYNTEGLSKDKLIYDMVGRQVVSLYPKRDVAIGEEVLSAKELSRQGVFKDVSFSVKKGEILGFTGLIGAGRTEVFEAIFGITKYDSGEIRLNGKPVCFRSPKEAIEAGVGFLPEDRNRQGLILSWEVYRNITLSTLNKYASIKGIDQRKEKRTAKIFSEKLGTKIKNVTDLVESLSGGNQQKVVVSKLLDSDLKVLILDEPTKGVDVGAKAQIYEIIMDLVEQGYAVILISSEMSEVISIADRIAIMANGRLMEIVDAKGITQERILETAMHISEH
ncbi:MAG: sugar ABC transporter ATP-binding protein [Flexilinea sp.]